jgi:hypothetical protein
MYALVYVYTYNNHVSVLSSHLISGKRGFLHNGKAGKITDYFFFEKLALCARIMKFEHLLGGNSNYCSLLDTGKANYFLFGKRSSLGAYNLCVFTDTTACCCSMCDVYLSHSVCKFL